MFPFGLLSSDNIKNMNSSNSMHKLDMIREFEITSTITEIDDICSNDIDIYQIMSTVNILPMKKNFQIFQKQKIILIFSMLM